MTHRTLSWLIIPAVGCSLGLGTIGCTSSSESGELPELPGEVVQSDLERNIAPSVSNDDASTLVTGNTAFAVNAYQQLVLEEDGNLFYSPLSISMALAMTYGGARTNTEAEMAAALHYDLPQDALHPAFNWLDLELGSRGQGAQGADGQGFRLNIANATFGQQGYQFLPAYLDLLALNYGAGMSLLDFEADPDAARQVINEWVAAATEDRIPDLLPPGIIKPSTTLVLTNAVYFNAAWKTPFEPGATTNGSFFTPTGEVTVPMMQGQPQMKSFEGSGFQAISLPYDGEELDMVMIMPDEGTFDAFENSLDGAQLASIFDSLQPAGALVIMPKFEFRFKADLVGMFQALGVMDAFTPSADFSGIDGTRNLAITGIVHEAFIKLNEQGTEATAATGVVVGPTSVPPTITIDRPFIFAIRDVATGSVVFLGRVVDPS